MKPKGEPQNPAETTTMPALAQRIAKLRERLRETPDSDSPALYDTGCTRDAWPDGWDAFSDWTDSY